MDKHSGPLILELYVFYLWNKKLRFWGSGEVYFAQTPYRSDAGYLEESKPKNWDLTPYTRKISWWAALLVEFTIWCAAMNLFNRAGTNSWSLTIHNAISIPITGIRPAFRGLASTILCSGMGSTARTSYSNYFIQPREFSFFLLSSRI